LPATVTALADSLASVVGRDLLVEGDLRKYLSDETESRNLVGTCSAVVRPATAASVAAVVGWAYEHDVPLVTRGGGTGYAGGAVPLDDAVVVSLERMTGIRRFDPLLWRMEVEAGVTTHEVQRLARENGLLYPPDPGAGEQSQIGGNIATNAGGPHAFKYGTTGAWVTGIEAVVPPGEIIRVGGAIRKDVAGYDLKHLLIGSEGTLGIITAAWLRLVPRPEASYPIAALYPTVEAGTAAIEAIVGTGLLVAALEFVDAGALAATRPTFFEMPLPGNGLVVLCEVDGGISEAEALRRSTLEVMAEGAVAVHAPTDAAGMAALWRWREGMTAGVTAQRGGKVSEDIVVPLDRLAEAIERTHTIGAEIGLSACSWGHAGDGNLHSTFMVDKSDPDQLAAAERGAEKLFALALELGGSISGEHGIGYVKRGHLQDLWPGRGFAIHSGIKELFDPKNLLNPGKKY
jgi:glycolate oxidase subunit GlcD